MLLSMLAVSSYCRGDGGGVRCFKPILTEGFAVGSQSVEVGEIDLTFSLIQNH